MSRGHRSGFWLIFVALTGCATAPVAPTASVEPTKSAVETPVIVSTWAEVCYDGFAEDVQALSGPDAQDCGFIAPEDGRGRVRAWRRCAREALVSGRPFRLGYRAFGTDSAYCEVAVRTPEGELIDWFFDFDVTGGSASGSESALWVSRCDAFRIGRLDSTRSSLIDGIGCAELKSGRAYEVRQARVR